MPVTGAPASMLSLMPRQEKWSSVVEKAHSFWRLAVTPTLSCGQERHLDAELLPDATELESTNCRCSSLCEYPEDKEVPGPHWPEPSGVRSFLFYFLLPPRNNNGPQIRFTL